MRHDQSPVRPPQFGEMMDRNSQIWNAFAAWLLDRTVALKSTIGLSPLRQSGNPLTKISAIISVSIWPLNMKNFQKTIQENAFNNIQMNATGEDGCGARLLCKFRKNIKKNCILREGVQKFLHCSDESLLESPTLIS